MSIVTNPLINAATAYASRYLTPSNSIDPAAAAVGTLCDVVAEPLVKNTMYTLLEFPFQMAGTRRGYERNAALRQKTANFVADVVKFFGGIALGVEAANRMGYSISYQQLAALKAINFAVTRIFQEDAPARHHQNRRQ